MTASVAAARSPQQVVQFREDFVMSFHVIMKSFYQGRLRRKPVPGGSFHQAVKMFETICTKTIVTGFSKKITRILIDHDHMALTVVNIISLALK
jgi:hypothetical protein